MATILIVDDSSVNRRFLVTLLRGHGHRLLEARDGGEGLAAARAEHPDLVITDVLMPVMDGYELVRQLRLDPTTSRVPVLFYTAPYGEREARTLAQSSGLPYVLTKPADPEEVLKIVARVLSGESELLREPDAAPRTASVDREHLRLLTGELSEKSGDLKIANARLRALINIGLEIASHGDTDRLIQSVCTAAHDLFCATYVTLGILDRNERTVRRIVTCGADAADWIRVGEAVPGILGTVVTERRTVRGDNAGGEPATLQLPPGHPEIQAFLAAPITSPAHVYGWICLVDNEGRAFTEDDEHLVTALSGQVGRIYELEHEVLERSQAVEARRMTEERMRFALQSASVGIWDLDLTTGALTWCETLESQYGMQPGTFAGTVEAFLERVHPQDRAALLETISKASRSGADFTEQHRTVWPDGTVRWLSGVGRGYSGEHGEPVRAVGISLDVTERRVLEEQYRQAQKMEAVGRLAGGVAHDFNNLLTAIMGYRGLLAVDLEPDDPRLADLAEIQKAAESAARLTRQLLAFSRKQAVEPMRLDLNVVVADMLAMLGRIIGEHVTIVLNLGPGPAAVMADRGQLEQVVLNLAVNARDAMKGGGTLTISTAVVDLDDGDPGTPRDPKAGPHVLLTVTDTGTGMTPEVQTHLFEPFFTTKPPGKGTGLGLATVYTILAQCDGRVTVESDVGKGTSFKVCFPRTHAAPIVVDPPSPEVRPRAGAHTVLVVDDDEGLRELVRRMLQLQGYTVLVAANANEALRLFERHAPIDLLLTDVVMPGASGPELTRRLVERQPALRVIYMSGHNEETIGQHGVLNPGIAFLHKPFTSESLGRKIREVFAQ